VKSFRGLEACNLVTATIAADCGVLFEQRPLLGMPSVLKLVRRDRNEDQAKGVVINRYITQPYATPTRFTFLFSATSFSWGEILNK
jgi:hypothetical protein